MRRRLRDARATLGSALLDALARCPPGLGGALVLGLAATLAAPADARPGGGHGFSGGGGGGGGGGSGGGGGGDVVWFLAWLIVRHPAIGIPVAIVVTILWLHRRARAPHRGRDDVDVAAPASAARVARATVPLPPPERRDLERVASVDPSFSPPLFLDFAGSLHAKAHRARHARRELDALAPWISDAARRHLASRAAGGTTSAVRAVILGSVQVVEVVLPADARARNDSADGVVRVACVFSANLVTGEGDTERSTFVRERWLFERAAAARTRPPEEVLSFHCPNCGAPFETDDGARCRWCGGLVTDGRADWTATSILVLDASPRPPSLRHHAAEVGTLAPTVIDPRLDERLERLRADDPEFSIEALRARLELVFDGVTAAWNERDMRPARPFVTDALFGSLDYWTRAYRAQGLVNRLDDAEVTRVVPAKLVRDRWHDALTVRLWASGLDVTRDERTGEVVGGSTTSRRHYSEYWTLIRRAGRRGAPRADRSCPNCGAPVERLNMAGTCEACDSHLTSGEFDWVLSRIEQDEAHVG